MFDLDNEICQQCECTSCSKQDLTTCRFGSGLCDECKTNNPVIICLQKS